MLIENNKFTNFITDLNEKCVEEDLYEYWLHRVFNKSYPDYKKDIQLSIDAQRGYMNVNEAKTVVKKSNEILSNFTPQ